MPKLSSLPKLLDREVREKNLAAARRALRRRYWLWSGREMRDPIFVMGCSRSGTTVTYETIAAAPGLLSFGYEIPQFWNSLAGPATNGWDSEAATREDAKPTHRQEAFAYFYQHLGRGWVIDKTCINTLRITYLKALFPDAYFVYIHRDGRDNISSMINGWRQSGHFGLTQFHGPSPDEVRIENGEFTEWSFFLPPGWRNYNRASLAEVCAFQWITANAMCLEAKSHIDASRWIQIRYEDLFTHAEQVFEQVFSQLGLKLEDAIRQRCRALAKHPTSIVKGPPELQKWRRHNPEAIAVIIDGIRPVQTALGYDCNL